MPSDDLLFSKFVLGRLQRSMAFSRVELERSDGHMSLIIMFHRVNSDFTFLA